MSSRPSGRWRSPSAIKELQGRRMSKTSTGNFFEDFAVGQEFRHATPRTLTEADAALNVGLYGSRFAINSSDEFARSIGLPRAPLDDLLVFHVVIGKTVNDISLNAVANLGYAEFRWGVPVYPGDTLSAKSTVLGLRENSNKASGVVWVRSTGTNQKGEMVLDYVRWVMVHKRDPQAAVAAPVVPKTAPSVAPADLIVPDGLTVAGYDDVAAGSVVSLGGLRAGRAHRPCERHHPGRLRPHALDAALPEHRARPFRRLCRQEHAVRPSPRVWRAYHLPGARAVLQRPRQRFPAGRDQLRQPRRADLRRRHDLCLVGGAGEGALPGRSDLGALASATIAPRIALRSLPGKGRRQVSPGRPRSRLWLLMPRRRISLEIRGLTPMATSLT
jgi:acyl dehydratase